MFTQFSFNVHAGKKHGVEGAVLLSHLVYWVYRNELNKQNFHDGNYWTYNTAESFTELFPFWNSQKIRRLLTKLEKENAIIIGCHNKARYDRTKWFTITKQTKSLYSNDFSKLKDGTIKNEKCNFQNEKMQPSKVKEQYQITKQITSQITTQKKEIILPFVSDVFNLAWTTWKEYKKIEKGFKFKSEISEQTALNNLQKISANDEKEAIEIIQHAIAQGWSGLFARKKNKGTKTFDTQEYKNYLESL
jgi:hypothetical protein